MRYTLGYKLLVAAGYAAILGWFAYHDVTLPEPAWYALWFAIPFVAGLLAGPWAALALPVAVLIAVPAGYGSGEAEIQIWVVMIFLGIVAGPAIVVGWAAKWLTTR